MVDITLKIEVENIQAMRDVLSAGKDYSLCDYSIKNFKVLKNKAKTIIMEIIFCVENMEELNLLLVTGSEHSLHEIKIIT